MMTTLQRKLKSYKESRLSSKNAKGYFMKNCNRKSPPKTRESFPVNKPSANGSNKETPKLVADSKSICRKLKTIRIVFREPRMLETHGRESLITVR